jgi:hypothetical protein
MLAAGRRQVVLHFGAGTIDELDELLSEAALRNIKAYN